MKEKDYLLAIHSFVYFGSVRLSLLKKYFGSYQKVWDAKNNQLEKIGISTKLIAKYHAYREKFDIDSYKNSLKRENVLVVAINDDNYPKKLTNIKYPPLLLHCKGNIDLFKKRAIAVVGSRKMTSYGRNIAESFSYELASRGLVIVSGLARGIDSVAHKAALKCGGSTIAVVANGLDRIYPPENRFLYKKIVENNSLIVSEYPLGYAAFPYNFPVRNRIVSGLSDSILVVEGRKKSGTLTTASHAADQGKEVYAVPGDITSQGSEASHFLLKNGAKLADSVESILEDFNLEKSVTGILNNKIVLSQVEENLLSTLDSGSLHIDEIVRICSLSTSEATGLLSMLELKGAVRCLGSIYTKV